MATEADTCRKFVTPKLVEAQWDQSPHSIAEQRTFTDGRIVVTGAGSQRRERKRADYILRYRRDFPIAVVEAKSEDHTPGAGLQQAKEYAEILGLKFAYSTNGLGIIEFDFTQGTEREIDRYPTPQELWDRLRAAEGIQPEIQDQLLTPYHDVSGKEARYYQEIAINRVVQAILRGERRVLLTMATGTGKTFVAFQICWKLWSAKWNREGAPRRPKILFLADRNVLVDDPKDKMFIPFGDARWKIESGNAIKSREMYFAIYQAIAKDENRPGLYKEYGPDFFDLIVVDECHRGSARDESNWREILDYFSESYQVGMTATPKRDDNIDTYRYFGNPLYTYSLRQGIEDGFLAPYRVKRVVTEWDAAGWRPETGQTDRHGRIIPDEEYHTKDFERKVALRARTKAIARHLTDHLKKSDRFSKTMVFCVDQDHAEEMRKALVNLNSDLVKQYPDYVCRVTSDEGAIGRGCLSRFQDVEGVSPVILTTSQMLTTGVDAPTCKNVALARVVGAMTEFKQIIGRGTRVREDCGKLFFTIVDYTGSATAHFADTDFDGEPDEIIEEPPLPPDPEDPVDEEPEPPETPEPPEPPPEPPLPPEPPPPPGPQKFYVDDGHVMVVHEVVHELDADGKKLRVVKLTDYTAEKVRELWPGVVQLHAHWVDPAMREQVRDRLADRGVTLDHLAEVTKKPDADPFDLLCHLAFNAPLLTRKQRAEKVRREKQDFFDQYGPEARTILESMLSKYAKHGVEEFRMPNALQIKPISEYGNPSEIAGLFGGAAKLKEAVLMLQKSIYSAPSKHFNE